MKKDKRFSLRLRTYYLLIIAIVVIISFGAVVGALTALQQLGVIGHINVSTLGGHAARGGRPQAAAPAFSSGGACWPRWSS